MDLKNMHLIDGSDHLLKDGIFTQPIKSYYVRDSYYNILSVHDFPVIPNQEWSATYPSYKERLNHRIDRFLEKITNGQFILFVRWSANYNQAVELRSILSQMVKGQFNILILNPVDGLQKVNEKNWEVDNICAVEVSNLPFDNSTWNYILNGITLTS